MCGTGRSWHRGLLLSLLLGGASAAGSARLLKPTALLQLRGGGGGGNSSGSVDSSGGSGSLGVSPTATRLKPFCNKRGDRPETVRVLEHGLPEADQTHEVLYGERLRWAIRCARARRGGGGGMRFGHTLSSHRLLDPTTTTTSDPHTKKLLSTQMEEGRLLRFAVDKVGSHRRSCPIPSQSDSPHPTPHPIPP